MSQNDSSKYCDVCPVPEQGPACDGGLCRCYAESNRRLCELIRMGREDYRKLVVAQSTGKIEARPVKATVFRQVNAEAFKERVDLAKERKSALLARVSACEYRGPVLPHSLQPEGCGCGELTECRAGKGKVPGRVTLRDCLACAAAAMDRPE